MDKLLSLTTLLGEVMCILACIVQATYMLMLINFVGCNLVA